MILERRHFLLATALLAVGGLLAACGSTSSGESQSPSSADAVPSVVAKVPAHYQQRGVLKVATDASYAPNEYFATDGTTIIGMDPDLAKAIAGVMGLRADIVNASFDSILPGLASGKYDLGISSFTDTAPRQKIVDFVTYFTAGTAFFEKTDGGPALSGISDLCGLKVSVEKGTTQAEDATAQSNKCTAAGKAPVSVQIFPDQAAANLAVVSGRADVGMADSPLAAYQVKQSNGTLRLVGDLYGAAPYGIAIPKESGLAPPVLAAVKAIQADGRYDAILKKWGVADGALAHPSINAATS